MLLPLLVPAEVAAADLPAVLRTISLRNKIVHHSGNLPDGIPEGTVREGISAVLQLARSLAMNEMHLRGHRVFSGLAKRSQIVSGSALRI